MPTNFADLPSNLAAPIGKMQHKRGVTDGNQTFTTATVLGTKMVDGSGGLMQITYTPLYPCIWIVRANVMSCGAVDGIGWRRWDWSIFISPADVNGVTEGIRVPCQAYDNGTVAWRTHAASYPFRLAANTAYTAYLAHAFLSGGSILYHSGPQWIRIMGRSVSEGVL
jgi:hypothetical protein